MIGNINETAVSVIEKVLTLCEWILVHCKENSEQAALARQLVDRLKARPALSLTRAAPKVGHRRYDQMIETLFTVTTTGVPREVFLKEALANFNRQGPESDQSIRLIIEADFPKPNAYPSYRGFAATGIQQDRWQNYRDKILLQLSESRQFHQLLFERQSLEVIHSDYLEDYAGEFSSLLDDHSAFWINAVALPSSASHYPNRSFIVLYPAPAFTAGKLPVPNNALQEWRVLHFVAIAYQHLSHQLAGLAEQVAARRTEMLVELAPGILHHEMGACLSLMQVNLEHQLQTVSQLLEQYEHPLLDELKEDNQALYNNAARLYDTVDAFNNLEQRRGRERIVLDDLFRQLLTICYHRLGESGVQLIYRASAQHVLQTDAALLLHLMLNIVINAINAIHEYPNRIQRKTILLRGECQDSDTLQLDFLNNGPPIDPDLSPSLFERGVTSRKTGHGQGLYICRMIAHYLGGSLALIDPKTLISLNNTLDEAVVFQAGFRLMLPLQLPEYKDLDSERRKRKT